VDQVYLVFTTGRAILIASTKCKVGNSNYGLCGGTLKDYGI